MVGRTRALAHTQLQAHPPVPGRLPQAPSAEVRKFIKVDAPLLALSSLIIGINLSADALAKALGVDRAQKAPL